MMGLFEFSPVEILRYHPFIPAGVSVCQEKLAVRQLVNAY